MPQNCYTKIEGSPNGDLSSGTVSQNVNKDVNTKYVKKGWTTVRQRTEQPTGGGGKENKFSC